jgi:hypothetical protein
MVQCQDGADAGHKGPEYDMRAGEIQRFQAAADNRLFEAGHGYSLVAGTAIPTSR